MTNHEAIKAMPIDVLAEFLGLIAFGDINIGCPTDCPIPIEDCMFGKCDNYYLKHWLVQEFCEFDVWEDYKDKEKGTCKMNDENKFGSPIIWPKFIDREVTSTCHAGSIDSCTKYTQCGICKSNK